MLIFPVASLASFAARAVDSDSAQVSVRIDHEIRTRFERRVDKDFSYVANDNRSDLLSRFRPGLTVTGRKWNMRLQLQYAHMESWTPMKNSSTENLDASQAYVQFKTGRGDFTVGRQKIILDDERLIGTLEWSNLARSMDGIRFENNTWDLFAFKLGISPNLPRDARIFAVSNVNRWGKTTYLLKTDRIPAGEVSVHTIDHVWKGNIGKTTQGEAEFVGQLGKVGTRELNAFAIHAQISSAALPHLKIGAEANLASGGSSTGNTKTFDNLYPTNHKFYGAADMQGWRNMQEASIFAGYQYSPAGNAVLSFHNFWLFDKSDGWYGAGGSINPRPGGTYIDPTGNSGRFVGGELDLVVSHKMSADCQLSFGAAIFQPGSFIKAMNPAQNSRQYWGFGSMTLKF